MKLFNKNLTKFIDKVSNWQEGLKLASDLLVDQGYVTSNFYDQLISETNRLGPYYILAKDLAMAHISPNASIKKNGMSLLYLKEPVAFSADGSHKVKFLFVLASVDQNSHLDLLKEMALLFGNQKFYQDFYHVKNFNEIINLLEQQTSPIK